MKNSFFFSLATAFVALALFVLISCGTMGDSSSSQSNGACIDSRDANLCFETSPLSFTEDKCKSNESEWISKCPYDYDNDLKCYTSDSDKYIYAYISGAMSHGYMCSDFDMHSDRKGSCQMHDEKYGLTLCMQSTLGSSGGLTEEQCLEDEGRWVSKCAEENYALKCRKYPAYVFIYGKLPSGATCSSLLGIGWNPEN
jgi:hypothetical protein